MTEKALNTNSTEGSSTLSDAEWQQVWGEAPAPEFDSNDPQGRQVQRMKLYEGVRPPRFANEGEREAARQRAAMVSGEVGRAVVRRLSEVPRGPLTIGDYFSKEHQDWLKALEQGRPG